MKGLMEFSIKVDAEGTKYTVRSVNFDDILLLQEEVTDETSSIEMCVDDIPQVIELLKEAYNLSLKQQDSFKKLS